MGRASTLTLYERGQIKVLSTTADCLSRQALQEGYYEFPNSERLDKLNDHGPDDCHSYWKDLRKELRHFQLEISVEEVRSTKTWLQDNSVDTMDWPSRSPDLNPMENLWFETAKDLQSAICKAWSEVDNIIIKNLFNSMPERIFQVINRSGTVY
uniref:DDE_3 domain-containing protein n=1 Tax=Heterorhabditis bacteriophora TaxID=37862 RepID=A0A1I7X967_HETBA